MVFSRDDDSERIHPKIRPMIVQTSGLPCSKQTRHSAQPGLSTQRTPHTHLNVRCARVSDPVFGVDRRSRVSARSGDLRRARSLPSGPDHHGVVGFGIADEGCQHDARQFAFDAGNLVN